MTEEKETAYILTRTSRMISISPSYFSEQFSIQQAKFQNLPFVNEYDCILRDYNAKECAPYYLLLWDRDQISNKMQPLLISCKKQNALSETGYND